MTADRRFLVVALLVLAAVVPFLPAVGGSFVWDDEELHIGAAERAANPLLFFVPGTGDAGRAQANYYPVSMTAFWLETRAFGRSVVGYHVVNGVLHAGNVLLAWGILRRLRVKWAFVGAMIFALHPLAVETVAYVSELKNLLSGVFALGTVWWWLEWQESRGKDQKARRVGVYAAMVGCFVMGMLAKSVVGVVPVVILLMEYWREGRMSRRVVMGLVPLFMVAGVIGGVFVWVEHSAVGASGVGFEYSFLERVLIAGRAVWFYVGKFVWPVGLLTVYPKWQIDVSAAWQWVFPAGVVLVLAALWGMRKRIGRGPFVAAAAFVVLIGPSLGFVNYYPMAFTFVANHYVYLGLLPLAALVATLGERWLGKWVGERGLAAGVAVLLVPLTWSQAALWGDPVALWGVTAQGNRESWYTTANYAYVLAQAGKDEEAAAWARESLALKEENARAHFTLALAELRQGNAAGAVGEYRRGLELEPTNAVAWANEGLALEQMGEVTGAEEAYERTLALNPDQPKVWNELAAIHLRKGEWQAAENAARKAIGVDPHYGLAWANLGLALEKQRRTQEAIDALERALALLPPNPRLRAEVERLRGMQAPASAP